MYRIKNLLLVLFTFLILSPLSMYAQWSGTDGFFGNDAQAEWRNESIDPAVLVIVTQNFGEVPIGNGLIVLGLSSIGYLVYRNRKKYKKSFIYLVICLFLLGMTGCHKKDITSHGIDTVSVTFNSNRSRTDITPLGQVTFSSGDKLHVFASGGVNTTQPRYLGVLTCNESGSSVSFTGSIYTWQANEKLSFYYLGNNSVNTSGTTIIDFSNQLCDGIVSSENNLANIAKHYHIGCFQVVALDDALTTTFNGQLKNMMALAVFDTDEFDDGTNVKILSESDLNNMVKINLDGTIEYCVAGINDNPLVDNQSGHIIIGVGSSNKYVALLPKSSDTPANVSLIFTSNDKVSSSNLNLQIAANSFLGYNNGSVIPYSISAIECSNDLYIDYPSPAECMSNPHVFTVMVGKTTPSNVNTVKKVVFSQGNLVYDQGRFKQHKNAWDVCQITDNSDINVNGTFDRFGWGASGYTFGQPIYQPYSNSTTQYGSSVGYGYGAPGNGYKQSFHPHPTYRRQDWGWYQFGMNCFDEYTIPDGWTSYWRTMGQGEWAYLFNSRSTTSINLIDYSNETEITNARFVKANVEGQNGIIIFPDTYVHPTSIHLMYINSNSENGLINNLLSAQDFTELHNAGAEFLPFGGYYDKRNEQIVYASGQYWSCKTQASDRAIYCKINVTEGVNTTTTMERYQGLFVRLVFQVEGVVE